PSKVTFTSPRWDIASSYLLGYVWLLGVFIVFVVIYSLLRYFRRSIEVAAAFFVATLGLLLGFIMLYTFRYTFVADHYQYLACIGPIALASAVLVNLADAFKNSRNIIFSAALCVVALLATLTWRQAAMYGNIETLWRTTVSRNPSC